MFLRGLVGVGADEFVAERGDGGGELFLHGALSGPADFVGGIAQVAVGDEENGFQFRDFRHGAEVMKIETLEKIGGGRTEILRSKRT